MNNLVLSNIGRNVRTYFTLLLILTGIFNVRAQTVDFTIHFEKGLYPYFIEIQKGSQKEKQTIPVHQADVTFQLEDSLSHFTLWVEGTEMQLPLFPEDIKVNMHLMYPIASLTSNDEMLNNWLSIIRIKKEIQDQLKLRSLTADTTQYVQLFEQHWSYYRTVLEQCSLKHPNMEGVCLAEKKWLDQQEANNWKKQKYRMGVNFRRLSFRERMRNVVGTQAINVRAITPDNDSTKLKDFKGKPIVIDFWATWCGPCKKEKPYWKKMEEKYGDQVHFVSIGVKSPKEQWELQLDQNSVKNEWFISKNVEGQLDPWNVYFIPRYILIDENFNVVITDLEGPSKRAFEQQVQKILQ